MAVRPPLKRRSDLHAMNASREEALFAAALERPLAERAGFLGGACLGDTGLRARVASLLASHDATANPLATRVGLCQGVAVSGDIPPRDLRQTVRTCRGPMPPQRKSSSPHSIHLHLGGRQGEHAPDRRLSSEGSVLLCLAGVYRVVS